MYIVQVEGANNCFAVSVFIQVDLIIFQRRFENHRVRGCWTKQHFECPIMTENSSVVEFVKYFTSASFPLREIA